MIIKKVMPNKFTKEDFIERAKKVHGDKYDYSKVEYVNNGTKVCIICAKHGEFWQTPRKHLAGKGCRGCSIKKNTNNQKMSFNVFIQKAKQVHGNDYYYDEHSFHCSSKKTKIICKKCNLQFEQLASSHLQGQGCPNCYGAKKKTNEQFIEQAIKVHGDKYDYSKIDYKNTHEKICIICPIHGEFWQIPKDHLRGCGCNKCKTSKIEICVEKILRMNNIIFDKQKKFDWLGRQSLDFYLPKYNIAIECQGEQHYKSIKHFGGEERLIKQIEKDKLKKQLCDENNVKLLYFANEKYDENIITDEKILLEEILS